MRRFEGVAEVVGGGLPDARVSRGSTALMVIDMQYMDAHRDYGLGAQGKANGWTEEMEYYFSRLESRVVPNIARLIATSRAAGLPIVHVRVMNLAADSSDTSWRYKMMGILVPPGSKDSEILEELEPRPGEVVLNKTTSSVFMSTNADFVLRNMGIDTLIMTGVVTNNCVESSVRCAADLGYRVLLVEDCCAAWTAAGHEYALRHLDHNYALVRSTQSVLDEIASLTASVPAT